MALWSDISSNGRISVRETLSHTKREPHALHGFGWLSYGIAIAGSFLLGPEQQKHEKPVASAVSLER